MNKFLSKGSRTLTVIGTVTVLTLLTMVPYGSRLMDRVASLMDPVQYTANVTMATTPRNGAQVTLRSKPTSSEQLLNLSQSSSEANDDIERNVKNPAAQNFSAVIILTYMRSGSSLTGEIMQQNPDSFYVFEPLFSLYVLYKARDSVYFLNETSLNYGDYNVTDLAVQTLRSWLTCDLQNVYLKGLKRFSTLAVVIGTIMYLYYVNRVHDEKILRFDRLAKKNLILPDQFIYTVSHSRSEWSQVGSGIKNFTAIILLTYMRSGSSLLGEILQQDPDAFYIFEPLHALDVSLKKGWDVNFLNGTSLKYGSYNWTEIAVPTIRAWLACDVKNIFERALFHTLFMGYATKTAAFHQCFEQNHLETMNETIEYCVNQLRWICLTSKFRVIKTIRMTMEQAKGLLTEIPQLKIVHLLRDPRDTMMSQKRVGNCKDKSRPGLAACASKYCAKMWNDIRIKEAETIFKTRVLTVFYEDIAFRPIESCGEIFSYLDMDFTTRIRNYVYNLTSETSKDGCKICQKKWQIGKSTKNASSHVARWRTKMSDEFRMIVDNSCKDSIIHLNYSFLNDSVPTGLTFLKEGT